MGKLNECIFDSINTARNDNHPFPHWIIRDFLTEEFCQKLFNHIPVAKKEGLYDGTRAGDYLNRTTQDITRFFLTADIIKQYPFLKEIITAMLCPKLVSEISSRFFTDLSNCYLRVEYIADRNGFYLIPHQDIVEKKLTVFVYLGDGSENCGTDLYDSKKKWVKTIPFKHNTGYIFVPGEDTWHGFEKKKINGIRRAILLNYVTFKTEWPLIKE